jgi:hypothetical protein
MSAVLVQIAIAFGMLMFFVSLGVGLASDVPVLTAIFRAFIALCVCSVALTFFFRFFVSVVYRFVAEQVLMQNKAKAAPQRPVNGGAENGKK